MIPFYIPWLIILGVFGHHAQNIRYGVHDSGTIQNAAITNSIDPIHVDRDIETSQCSVLFTRHIDIARRNRTLEGLIPIFGLDKHCHALLICPHKCETWVQYSYLWRLTCDLTWHTQAKFIVSVGRYGFIESLQYIWSGIFIIYAWN